MIDEPRRRESPPTRVASGVTRLVEGLLGNRPGTGDFNRVDHESALPEGRQRAHVISSLEPPFDEALHLELLAPPHSSSTMLMVASTSAGSPSSRHDQRALVDPKVAQRLNFVVETQHRGSRPALKNSSTSVKPFAKGGERVGAPSLVVRSSSENQSGLGDHAESALRANEGWRRFGPTASRGPCPPSREHRRWQHDSPGADEILDRAVAIGILSGAATGDPTADRGEIKGLGKVTSRGYSPGANARSRSGQRYRLPRVRCPTRHRSRSLGADRSRRGQSAPRVGTAPPTTLDRPLGE